MRGCSGLFASKRSVARLAPTVYNYRATLRVQAVLDAPRPVLTASCNDQGRISIIVPSFTRSQISRMSLFFSAMQPLVQSKVWKYHSGYSSSTGVP